MKFNEKWKRFWTLDKHHADGFTLVELIVVIAILAILSGVAVPAYSGYIKKAEQAADEQLLAVLNTAYAAACMENGEYDMKNLSFGPTAKLNDGVVTMGTYHDSFQRYFAGNGAFKYYDTLGFNSTEGVFVGNTIAALAEALKAVWNGCSFDDGTGAVTQELLETFDLIGSYFSVAASPDFDLEAYLLEGISDGLANALGLKGMAAGFEAAMNLSESEIEAIMEQHPNYSTMDDEAKAALRAQIMGNAGVLHFAQDATGRSPEEVRKSMDNFVNVLGAAWDTSGVTDEELEAYYLSVANDTDKADYLAAKAAKNEKAILDNFRNKSDVIALSEDLKFSGAQAAAMAKAAEGSGNTAGITMLGSMYAIAAGYYNSNYYNPETDGEKPSSYGNFDSITGAMSNDSFWNYYYGVDEEGNYLDGSNSQAQADMEAYLNFMEYMSTNPNVSLENSTAFSDQYGFMNGVFGYGESKS